MIVLFILGALGVKAAVAVYIVYRIAKAVTAKGDAIKQGYESHIEALEKENQRLRRPVFVQARGRA